MCCFTLFLLRSSQILKNSKGTTIMLAALSHALPLTDPVGGGFQNARDGIGYSSPTELRSQIWGYTLLCVPHTSTPN